jgi:NifU-like protein
MVKGLTLEEAQRITNEDIADFLGGLPKEKMHCSVMGRDALEKAIGCYLDEPEKKVEGEIVCECFGVTDREIERVVRENQLTTIDDVTDYVKAGGGCGNCAATVMTASRRSSTRSWATSARFRKKPRP